MRIKDVEGLVGMTKKNIRFYEKEGLLSPGRSVENSYRDYSMEDVRRLKEIKLLRKLDMPIREIRDILEGRTSMETAASRHVTELEGRIKNLSHAKDMSCRLASDGSVISALDVDECLALMEKKEMEGILFVNIKNRDIGRKYAGPIIACICVVLVMSALTWVLLWANSLEPIPAGLVAGLIAIPVIVALGTVASLVSRVKEIKRGEENDLSQY